MWVIFGVHLRKWWSEDGWVDKSKATKFTSYERETMTLPFAGVWERVSASRNTAGFAIGVGTPICTSPPANGQTVFKASRLKRWHPPIESLEPVFADGKLLRHESLADVRERVIKQDCHKA